MTNTQSFEDLMKQIAYDEKWRPGDSPAKWHVGETNVRLGIERASKALGRMSCVRRAG